MLEDSSFLRVRIECALDEDGMFKYTKEDKIERLETLKKDYTNELETHMYPQEETETLKKLLKDIDNHLLRLNAL